MKRITNAALMAAVLAAGFVVPNLHLSADVPAPSIAPISWELTFKPQKPERLIMTLKGEDKPKVFWFMRYKVINNTHQDLLFTPEFRLLTDTGQAIESGKNIPDEVFDKIKATYNNPLLDSPLGVLGKLLQGEDNAKESVAIFTGVDADARQFTFQISGIYGETAETTDPITHEKVVLRKTLVLDYSIPGEAIGIDPRPQLKNETYIMKQLEGDKAPEKK